ncbi:MAG TPA: TetR/AcrR family transcriptional regulator C-terminal domain-containing protein [Rhodopseudomonas sp.]|uniref:TetR/AcrR family transcriptional regulator C-terminal domain-containing protein n=1 Tax=Rhodopseudomonas sp. TaxID=1078 RepID=UPI002ED7A33F
MRDTAANLAAQAAQCLELAKLTHEEGWPRAVRSVPILLQRFAARGKIKVDDIERAADLFLDLLLGQPSRLAICGLQPTHTFKNYGGRLLSNSS